MLEMTLRHSINKILSFLCAPLHVMFTIFQAFHCRYVATLLEHLGSELESLLYSWSPFLFPCQKLVFCSWREGKLFATTCSAIRHYDLQKRVLSIIIFRFLQKCKFAKSTIQHIIMFFSCLRMHQAWNHQIVTTYWRVTTVMLLLAKKSCQIWFNRTSFLLFKLCSLWISAWLHCSQRPLLKGHCDKAS